MHNFSWYTNNSSVDSPDAIHQILAFGSLDDIKSLKRTLGEDKLIDLFLQYPKKVYTSPALNFIKNFILHIPSSLDDQKYLKFTSRNIR
ncbi:MAG TPA: hypothetical protein VMR41_01805 [Patescibacteria group bacterium]|nr:hypothetical protein [Patescibacteria group bacterium]